MVMLAAVAAQMAFAQALPCSTFLSSVTVQISTAGNKASVSQDRVCISPGGRVNWTSADGERWAADFPGDPHSPFPAGKTHHGGNVHQKRGDKVRACRTDDAHFDQTAGGCKFKYTATHVKGGNSSVLDPDVVVKPGT